MLTVYGDIRSGNCLKVKWLLDRLRRDYRWVEVDIMMGGSRTPEFLSMNAAGQVPTVVFEDGRPLAQSNAILLHLAEGTDLIVIDPLKGAPVIVAVADDVAAGKPHQATLDGRTIRWTGHIARIDAAGAK